MKFRFFRKLMHACLRSAFPSIEDRALIMSARQVVLDLSGEDDYRWSADCVDKIKACAGKEPSLCRVVPVASGFYKGPQIIRLEFDDPVQSRVEEVAFSLAKLVHRENAALPYPSTKMTILFPKPVFVVDLPPDSWVPGAVRSPEDICANFREVEQVVGPGEYGRKVIFRADADALQVQKFMEWADIGPTPGSLSRLTSHVSFPLWDEKGLLEKVLKEAISLEQVQVKRAKV